MAVRKAIVRTLPPPGSDERKVIGQLIDDGVTPPYGTTPAADDILRADPRDRFDRHYLGYSNGYTYETVPELAVKNPGKWDEFLGWARGAGKGSSRAEMIAKLDQMSA